MDNTQAKKIGEIMSILYSLMECSKKNCLKEKQAIEKNKYLIAKKAKLGRKMYRMYIIYSILNFRITANSKRYIFTTNHGSAAGQKSI